MKALLLQGASHVMLNMTGVTYVDSAGLGALVGLSLTARQQGRAVTLVNPSQRLVELLAMAKLQKVVTVCDSEAQALS